MSAKRAASALLEFDCNACEFVTQLSIDYKQGKHGTNYTANKAITYLRSIYTLTMCASAANVPENAVITVILFDWLRLGAKSHCMDFVRLYDSQ